MIHYMARLCCRDFMDQLLLFQKHQRIVLVYRYPEFHSWSSDAELQREDLEYESVFRLDQGVQLRSDL